ncbi:proton-translocating transhydrogenase family protein [Elioraea thermophila]|uniref:proton-translocating transhydrogenase family protein n=1 Tax=Elioraea thermophila TaxID=2185104 RepID=UPI000DF2F38D|nr:proton-translocating transhydrogenase family protein [Elioraea thermophila]
MSTTDFASSAADLARDAAALAERAQALAAQAAAAAGPAAEVIEPFLFLLSIFLLACFVGYYVVWNVTPALHSPLMGVTNAISSVIVVGGLLAVGLAEDPIAQVFGFLAVLLASVNIFGGFLVTHRMLSMFRKKGG